MIKTKSPTQTARNRAPRAVISGFVAMIAMILVFLHAYYIAYLLARMPSLGETLVGWSAALINNPVISVASGSIYMAVAVHTFAGIVWALVYAYIFEPRLTGSGWLKGAIFSLLPWILSLVVLLPLLGGGFFGLEIGAGPLPIIGNLILHLSYGVVLGAMYAMLVRMDDTSAEEQRAERNAERTTSIGLITGAVIGAIIGVVVAVIPVTESVASSVGVSPWFFAVGSALIGSAWGGLIGSLSGFTRRS
jgi:hypothetical protein